MRYEQALLYPFLTLLQGCFHSRRNRRLLIYGLRDHCLFLWWTWVWRGFISDLGMSICMTVSRSLNRLPMRSRAKVKQIEWMCEPFLFESPGLSWCEKCPKWTQTFDVFRDFTVSVEVCLCYCCGNINIWRGPVKEDLCGVWVWVCTLSSHRLTVRTDVEHGVVQHLNRCVMLDWSPDSCRAVTCTT